MPIDSWLPVAFALPFGGAIRRTLWEGSGWQIAEVDNNSRILLCGAELSSRWIAQGLLQDHELIQIKFGLRRMGCLPSTENHLLVPIAHSPSPKSQADAIAFSLAIRATRNLDRDSPLHDSIYAERYARLLPTFTLSPQVSDDVVLGYWLSGGAPISAKSTRRLAQALTWLEPSSLERIVEASGVTDRPSLDALAAKKPLAQPDDNGVATEERANSSGQFRLLGRPALEAFFNEHIVDIVQNREKYKRFGINFPGSVILHGKPGCGKTYAVERLIDFLGWPSYQIEASSVASPYIHETSRKVAQVFDEAISNSPSVIVIDEMEAFLSEREQAGSHRVEEIAEFLRRIPEATKNNVLVIAMTNRLDFIDQAILRRGRFDHILEVGMASPAEVLVLLDGLLSSMPLAPSVNTREVAASLNGRPLSDISFVVREAARQAVKDGKSELEQEHLMAAVTATPSREPDAPRRIGFT